MFKKKPIVEKPKEEDGLDLTKLKLPIYVAHLKAGTTLGANNDMFILQDGSTTLEIRLAPKFQPNKIPWQDGLLRDIFWSHELGKFLFLTQKALFAFDPKSIFNPTSSTTITTQQVSHLTVGVYQNVQPIDDKNSFWRCTSVQTTVYVSYSGFATTVDEYSIGKSSHKLINRWMSPRTCAYDEGIWGLRCHPNTGQLGMTIMNARNNNWRFEIRDRKNFAPLLQVPLPITNGDCELSPVDNGRWLGINSCGIRLIHIEDEKIKAAVEYERELKNCVMLGKDHFVVRTKYTVEVHSIKKDMNEEK